MKKVFALILLTVMLCCAACLSACDSSGEITAEKWEELVSERIPSPNVTIKVTEFDDGNVSEKIIANLDLGRGKFFIRNEHAQYGYEKYYSIENEEYYTYSKNDEGKWEKYWQSKPSDDPLGAKTLLLELGENLKYYWDDFTEFKDKFDLFEYDEETEQYVALNVDLHYDYNGYNINIHYDKVVYKFDNEKPVYVELQFDADSKYVFEIYDYNTTNVTLPKNAPLFYE